METPLDIEGNIPILTGRDPIQTFERGTGLRLGQHVDDDDLQFPDT